MRTAIWLAGLVLSLVVWLWPRHHPPHPCSGGSRDTERVMGHVDIVPEYGGVVEFEELDDWRREDCHEERTYRVRTNGGQAELMKVHRKPEGKTPCTYCDCADCDCQDHCYRHCRDGDRSGFRPRKIDADGSPLPDDYGPDTCWCID